MTTQVPVSSQETGNELVLERLAHFHILPNRWIRLLLEILPLGIILWFVGGVLRMTQQQTLDIFLLSAFLCVVIVLVLLRTLFERVPEVLRTLWLRAIFKPGPDGKPVEQDLLVYLRDFNTALNHPLAHALGVVFAILAVGTTYHVLDTLSQNKSIFTGEMFWTLVQTWRFLYLPIGYLIGWLIWRVFVIAFFIERLGLRFRLKVQSNHPDGSGGLRPLGVLCLLVALVVLVPAIFYGIWAFINLLVPGPYLAVYQLWAPVFRLFLFALILIGLLVFFQPLYRIHRQMLDRRDEIQRELDRLSEEMDTIVVQLRANATSLTPQQGAEKLETLKFLQQVYTENSRVPIWPFDWKLLARFLSAQLLPLMSLVLSSSPVLTGIQSALKIASSYVP